MKYETNLKVTILYNARRLKLTVKRIQCFLNDLEAAQMSEAKEKLGLKSDYSFVKLAISELTKKCLSKR